MLTIFVVCRKPSLFSIPKVEMISHSVLLFVVLASSVGSSAGHGLVEEPASRNWFCGGITKPHHTLGGGGQYPECEAAFANDWNGGYQFMSVLTHDTGRTDVKTTTNVCGFDSETWQGGSTPWDVAMDWPTTPMTPGINEIKWNIAWGPVSVTSALVTNGEISLTYLCVRLHFLR